MDIIITIVVQFISSLLSMLFILYLLDWFFNNRKIIYILVFIFTSLMVIYGIYQMVTYITHFEELLPESRVYLIINSIMTFLPFIVGLILISRVWHISLFRKHKIKYRKKTKTDKILFSIKKSSYIYYIFSVLLLLFTILVYFYVENVIIRYIIIFILLLLSLSVFYYAFVIIKNIKEYILIRIGKTQITTYLKKLDDINTPINSNFFNLTMYYSDYVGKVKITYLNHKREIHYLFILPNDNLMESLDSTFISGILDYEDFLKDVSKIHQLDLTLKQTIEGFKKK